MKRIFKHVDQTIDTLPILPVKPTRSLGQSKVKLPQMIRCRNDHDTIIVLESIKLIELPLRVSSYLDDESGSVQG
jgi:hypothetical protein